MAVNISEHVATRLENGVFSIHLTRTQRKNALTHGMYAGLTQALEQAEANPDVRAILLASHEGIFTAGNDLGEFLQDPPGENAPVFIFLQRLQTLQKPIVAAVSGPAVGVGTTILLHCDLVYCDTTAQFRLPFVALGLCPEAGSSLLLPQQIGYLRAAELLLLAEPFGADRALALGVVSAVLPPEQLAEVALSKALALAAQPPAALRLTKKLLRQASQTAVAAQMTKEKDHFLECLHSPEAREAIAAILEKRKPDFSKMG